MNSHRKYGEPPFSVVVIHGGPGTPGYMAPVARELSAERGVLEPFQTVTTVEGQIRELYNTIARHTDGRVILIGSSWGAMLGYMFAAQFPETVAKLIIIGSAVFEEEYAQQIMQVRLSRLNEAESIKAEQLTMALDDDDRRNKDEIFGQLGTLVTKADTYDPLTLDTEVISTQYKLHCEVWGEAQALRRSGSLLELGGRIKCPVVAIHGDYDPHPAEGVRKPLTRVLRNFRFITLKDCGHYPWIERQARDEFFSVLKQELDS